MIERGRELHAAARHLRVRGLGAQDRVGGDLLRRLGDQNVVGRHPAGGDGGLRLGAALEQAALDEQAIDADARVMDLQWGKSRLIRPLSSGGPFACRNK